MTVCSLFRARASTLAVMKSCGGAAGAFGGRMDWDVSRYRATSPLLDHPLAARRRLLVSFGLNRDGLTGLRLYINTAHLALALVPLLVS